VRHGAGLHRSQVSIAPTPLPEDPATLQRLLLEAQAEITRLQMLIAGLLRHRFGRRSEQLSEDALDQGIEDLEQSLAEQTAKIEAATQPVARPAPPKRNRGSLPDHLPRLEVVIDVADKTCTGFWTWVLTRTALETVRIMGRRTSRYCGNWHSTSWEPFGQTFQSGANASAPGGRMNSRAPSSVKCDSPGIPRDQRSIFATEPVKMVMQSLAH
jgi:hypothetical protein